MVWVLLGGVWLRVGAGVGVEEGGIAAEGAQDVGGGFVAVEDAHWGAVVGGLSDEQDHGALSTLRRLSIDVRAPRAEQRLPLRLRSRRLALSGVRMQAEAAAAAAAGDECVPVDASRAAKAAAVLRSCSRRKAVVG